MATPSKPLGSFDLPREIRDEIYRLYFSKAYKIPRFIKHIEIDNSMMLLRKPIGPRTPPQSHIFQISQTMHREAEEIFYNDCTFHLDAAKPWPSGLCQPLADRITSLEVDIVAWPGASYNDPILQRFFDRELGRKFCSFTTSRNTVQGSRSTRMLITLLKKFVRYETVIIRVCVPEFVTNKLPGKELCQGRRKADWPPLVEYERSFKEMLHELEEGRNKMRIDLESTLGPGEMFDEGSHHCVEFHPIVHSTGKH